MDMSNLHLLFDAHVNSKAYKIWNLVENHVMTIVILSKSFAVNTLVWMPICCGFRCESKKIQMKVVRKNSLNTSPLCKVTSTTDK